jgi:hypothetical protein
MANFEPTMESIEDYNGNESAEKKRTIRYVIIALLAVGVIYTTAHHYFGTVDDQIEDAPYLLKRF